MTIRLETLRAKLELVNLFFTRHVDMDKVNFLFTKWTNLPDSVNLKEAREAAHVIRLPVVSKPSFDIAVQHKVQFVNNVIVFGVFIRCGSRYLKQLPPPNKVHIHTGKYRKA